ncbi:hypothetical protein D7Y61_04185 [Stenotrophomonas maltophilia]|nr:hypothetical protein [Stenotrophomonas maltophilia]
MSGCRWAAMALSMAAVVAAQCQWPVPPLPSPLAFQAIPGDRFSNLRRQAIQFVDARQWQGFHFVERKEHGSFQVHCRGVPVLWLENRPEHVLMQTSLDAEQRAPEVLQLRAFLRWQLQPLDYLEQVLIGVPEPVLMDRVLGKLAGGVPDGVRCVKG